MTKRARDGRLTREQLEAGDYGEEDVAQQNDDWKANTAQLGQRKIVKVRRHIQATGEVQSEIPKKPAQFMLAGSLSGQAAATKASTFSFAPAQATSQPQVENGKTQEADKEAKVETNEQPKNLFGQGGNKIFNATTGGTFAGVTLKKEDAPAAAVKPLFGAGAASGGLFGGPATGGNAPLFKPASGGTFGGKKLQEATAPTPPAPVVENKNAGSLFGGAPLGNKPAGGSLFGNLDTIKKTEAEPTKPGSLFGGNPTTSADSNQKFGLFGASSQVAATKDESKPTTTSTSLFGNNTSSTAAAATGGSTSCLFGGAPPTGGLFGAKPPTTGSLFGGAGAPATGGLFSNANKGPSLFSFGGGATAAPLKTSVDQESDGEVENEGEKSPPIYADSTTKVDFKGAGAQAIQPSPYTKLFEKHVNTFKIVKPEDQVRKITNCEISLEFAEVNGSKVFVLAVRQAKKVLIQGTLNAKVSRCRKVEEKSAKNQLKLAMQQNIDVQVEKDGIKTKQKKVVFPYCVVNFSRQEEMIIFETEFTKAVEELKKAPAAK